MIKKGLSVGIAKELGLTQVEVKRVVDKVFENLTGALARGERIELRNFGVFGVKSREARKGRNPRTGEVVPIPRKKVVYFKPGKKLKQMVNK